MGPEWIVLGVVMGLLVSGVGAAAVRVATQGNPYQEHMEARWRALAEQLGGRLEVPSRKALEPRPLHLIAEVDEVEAVASVSVPVAAGSVSHTTVRSAYVLGIGPTFLARPRRANEARQASMPAGLISSRERAAASAFGPQARDLVDAIERPLTVRSEDGRIELIWDGAEEDATVIERTLRLAAALARHGSDLLEGLSTIDDATLEAQSAEGPRVRVRRGLVDVRFLVVSEDDAPMYLARVDARDGTPQTAIEVDEDGALGAEPPEGLVAPDAEPELPLVGPATLRSDGASVELAWRESPDLDQARAAVRLLAAIGVPSGTRGAFR